MNTEKTDIELLRAVKRNPQVFGEFYDRHWRWLLSWFYRRTGDEHVALDLNSEIFALVLRKPSRCWARDDGSVAPWLYGAAKNLVRDYQRSCRRQDRARKKLAIKVESESIDDSNEIVERLAALDLSQEPEVIQSFWLSF